MAVKETVQERYRRYLAGLQASGLSALDDDARRELATLLVHEARKGAFDLTANTDGELLQKFIEHFKKEFAEDDDLKLVLDYSWDIRESARAAAGKNELVQGVILYATWVEHWLHGVLLTRALAGGMREENARDLVRQSTLQGKLSWVWLLLELTSLSKEDVGRLTNLAEVRNEYVHYKWLPKPLDHLDRPDPRLVAALEGIEALCNRLIEYELDNISSPALPTAERVFGVALRDMFRQQ